MGQPFEEENAPSVDSGAMTRCADENLEGRSMAKLHGDRRYTKLPSAMHLRESRH